jgi:hypothetical protein
MRPDEQAGQEPPRRAPATPHLEDLIPIAVMIAAGCETCAERMVRRALERGSGRREIERTLAIVANLRSLDCFGGAVGADVVERMARPLRTGERVLRGTDPMAEDGTRPRPSRPGPSEDPDPMRPGVR